MRGYIYLFPFASHPHLTSTASPKITSTGQIARHRLTHQGCYCVFYYCDKGTSRPTRVFCHDPSRPSSAAWMHSGEKLIRRPNLRMTLVLFILHRGTNRGMKKDRRVGYVGFLFLQAIDVSTISQANIFTGAIFSKISYISAGLLGEFAKVLFVRHGSLPKFTFRLSQVRSPRIRRASCMSLAWIVTRLAWIAQRFVSANNPTR